MKRKIVLLVAFLFSLSVPLFSLDVGEIAPSFANPDLSGKFFLSKKIIGQNWVILDFFATDCKGCKKEIPELEALYKDFEDRGLQIFIFATDREGSQIVRKYFAENPTNLTVLIDRYLVTAKKYGVEEIPSVFLVGPDKKIKIKGVGYSKEVIEEMRKILSEAMK